MFVGRSHHTIHHAKLVTFIISTVLHKQPMRTTHVWEGLKCLVEGCSMKVESVLSSIAQYSLGSKVEVWSLSRSFTTCVTQAEETSLELETLFKCSRLFQYLGLRDLLGKHLGSLLCDGPFFRAWGSKQCGGTRNFSLGMARPWQKQPHSHSRQAPGCLYVTGPCSLDPMENCHQQLPSCLMLMQSARSLYTWRQFRLRGDWLKFKRSHAIVILKRNFMIHHFWCNLICLIKLYFTHSSFLMGQFK